MAYALRSITNAGYCPYGSGRDWFFLGDFSYKHGRRTPDPNTRWKEEQKGLTQPKSRRRGEPQEIRITKSISGQLSSSSPSQPKKMSPRVCERLRRQQSEPTCNDALQAGSKGAIHANRWREANSSSRPKKAANGCLRPAGSKIDTDPAPPWPYSCSSELGQVHLLGHSYSFSEFGAPEKHRFHSSRCNAPPKEEADDYMREMPGKQKWPPMQASKFYQNALHEAEKPLDKPLSRTTSLECGHPAKHHNFTNKKIFPPSDLEREQPQRPAGWRPPEWGMPDKHRFHQPPLYAPKELAGTSRIPPGKECEIPGNWRKNVTETMASYCQKQKLHMI